MSPSLRPTASPCAWRVRWLCSLEIVSMLVVFPASIASPLVPFSGAMPHPSCTLFAAKMVSGCEVWDEIGIAVHEADLVLYFNHGEMERMGGRTEGGWAGSSWSTDSLVQPRLFFGDERLSNPRDRSGRGRARTTPLPSLPLSTRLSSALRPQPICSHKCLTYAFRRLTDENVSHFGSSTASSCYSPSNQDSPSCKLSRSSLRTWPVF